MEKAAFLILLSTLFLTGCQTSGQEDPSASASGAAVSSIPWNKPASWEGSGALGGFSPQGGGH
jgi:PBP1b-binding outer membrane lipoprotein LpoB